MKKFRKLKQSDFMKYESIHEFVEHLSTEKCGGASTTDCDPSWYGTESYEDAVKKLMDGDEKLAKKVKGFDKFDINMPIQGTRRKMATGVCGFAPHVPNYLAGVPNNMIFCREEKVPQKVITIMYGSNMLAEVTVDEMAKVSARVLAAIMSMERKGYRVNLYVANCAKKSSLVRTGFIVKLKDAGQHLDPIKCAFPMISASWNRRFAFHFREMCGWGHDMGSSQYGVTLRNWLTDNGAKYDVAFGYYDAKQYETVEGLEKLFLESINKNKYNK